MTELPGFPRARPTCRRGGRRRRPPRAPTHPRAPRRDHDRRAGGRRPRRRRRAGDRRHRPRRQGVRCGRTPARARGIDARRTPPTPRTTRRAQDEFNRTKPSFSSAPALGDLDGDGKLEIVAAAIDRHVYAWHGDGTPVAGFPVLVVDPAKVRRSIPQPPRDVRRRLGGARRRRAHRHAGASPTSTATVVPRSSSARRRSTSSRPNIGDGADVLGLLGATGTAGNSRLYVISPDGSLGARLAGQDRPRPNRAAADHRRRRRDAGGDRRRERGPSRSRDPGGFGGGAGVRARHRVATASTAPGPAGRTSRCSGRPASAWRTQDSFGANRNSERPRGHRCSVSAARPSATSTATAPPRSLAPHRGAHPPDRPARTRPPAAERRPAVGVERRHPPAARRVTPGGLGPRLLRRAGGRRPRRRRDSPSRSRPTARYTVSAFDGNGSAPPGWPKLTGGWAVGTPGVGDWDGDGTLEVAVPRRDGVLFVWHTAGTLPASWSAWGCDPAHTGACTATTEQPPPPPSPDTTSTTVAATGVSEPGPAEEAAAETTGTLPATGRDIGALGADRAGLRCARPRAQQGPPPTDRTAAGRTPLTYPDRSWPACREPHRTHE